MSAEKGVSYKCQLPHSDEEGMHVTSPQKDRDLACMHTAQLLTESERAWHTATCSVAEVWSAASNFVVTVCMCVRAHKPTWCKQLCQQEK